MTRPESSSTADTVFALATPPGQGGLAVIRVSGSKAVESLAHLSRKAKPIPRMARFCRLKDPQSGDILDEAVCTYFQSPHSFTGEDVVEYALHGSRAVVDKMLAVLSQFKDHRMAEPGEFTKRAFLNGKLDLTAAEAVADLIHAETEAQRVMALDQLGGRLERLYHDWAERLAKLLAHQEAEIEFPDEDMPDGIDDAVRQKVESLIFEIKAHLNDGRKGERLREGVQIAIIGAPNAGKSSFLNWLAQREAAIVSDIAGTTRDIVEVSLNLGGYPAIIADTAGLRTEHSDQVEQEGIRRAMARAEEADIKIVLFDATAAPDFDATTRNLIDDNTLIVINKIDLVTSMDIPDFMAPVFQVSLATEDGIDQVLVAVTQKVKVFFKDVFQAPLLTRTRHRQHLTACVSYLTAALENDLPELAAEDLRQALLSIGRMTGRVDIEDLLDIVFRDFCIGK